MAGAIKEGGCTSFLAPILIPEGPSVRAEPAQPAPPPPSKTPGACSQVSSQSVLSVAPGLLTSQFHFSCFWVSFDLLAQPPSRKG